MAFSPFAGLGRALGINRGGRPDFFEGAVVAITGAGSGIGRALALELSRRGAYLALADIDTDGMARTVGRCTGPGAVSSTGLDVGDRPAVERYARDTIARFGRVDIVINCAGILHVGSAPTSPVSDFDTVMRTNFFGTLHVTTAFLPALRRSDRPARVVTMSSAVALAAMPGHGPYTVSKFAIRGFTEALRADLADTEIEVVGVYPGGIRTTIARSALVAPDIDKSAAIARFEHRVARTDVHAAAVAILAGVTRGAPRVLVGADARLADLAARIGGPHYDKLITLAAKFT
ncbi:SDR family NAD(P)-dependent oxidoreductase [Nocardia blacklockiae]|uniref:SDR family NAD(P)-dependent oxidoreductase n=1 Tax=Nocardia blacklockiae TaxID=480036 RepID=UPI001895B53B|nr:SDR family oxidoreductase [Nocardia blacklockiae]MBF6175821.1 SDR family oxidoreductase [Nocardia blacklockiae]